MSNFSFPGRIPFNSVAISYSNKNFPANKNINNSNKNFSNNNKKISISVKFSIKFINTKFPYYIKFPT